MGLVLWYEKPLDPGFMDRQWIASGAASLLIETG